MPRLRVKALVTGPPDQVYERVTAFPVNGPADNNALESRYGKLLEQENNNTYTFWEDGGGGVTWQCAFDPPHQRVMRAVDSSWSDRIDQFAPVSGGTLWTITWELKARGLPSYTQWLVFHLRDKKRVRQQLVSPVVAHFRQASPAD